jgi:hypothetical protein
LFACTAGRGDFAAQLTHVPQPAAYILPRRPLPTAIRQVDWPAGLMGGQDHDLRTSQDGGQGGGQGSLPSSMGHSYRGRLRQMLGVGSLGFMSMRSGTSGGGSSWMQPPHAGPLAPLPSFSGSGGDAIREEQQTDEALTGEGHALAERSGSKQGSVSSDAARQGAAARGASDGGEGATGTGGSASLGGGTDSFRNPAVRTSSRDSAGRTFLKLLMRQGASASPDAAFNGLRVRMGVATGRLAPGVKVTRSAVYDLAKGERRAPCLIIRGCSRLHRD